MVGVYWEHPRKMDDDWGDPHFRKPPHAAGKIHQEMDVAMDVAMVDVAMFDLWWGHGLSSLGALMASFLMIKINSIKFKIIKFNSKCFSAISEWMVDLVGWQPVQLQHFALLKAFHCRPSACCAAEMGQHRRKKRRATLPEYPGFGR